VGILLPLPVISSAFLQDLVTFPRLSCRVLRDSVAVIIDLGTQASLENKIKEVEALKDSNEKLNKNGEEKEKIIDQLIQKIRSIEDKFDALKLEFQLMKNKFELERKFDIFLFSSKYIYDFRRKKCQY